VYNDYITLFLRRGDDAACYTILINNITTPYCSMTKILKKTFNLRQYFYSIYLNKFIKLGIVNSYKFHFSCSFFLSGNIWCIITSCCLNSKLLHLFILTINIIISWNFSRFSQSSAPLFIQCLSLSKDTIKYAIVRFCGLKYYRYTIYYLIIFNYYLLTEFTNQEY